MEEEGVDTVPIRLSAAGELELEVEREYRCTLTSTHASTTTGLRDISVVTVGVSVWDGTAI